MNNEPMTQERLDAIRERVEVATKGPWAVDSDDPSYIIHSERGGWDGLVIAQVADQDGALFPVEHNGALIAHAPQDMADLLAEVERLRALTTVDDAKIERVARNLANLQVGEAWPTTRELGGVPRSGRDEEYRSAMREWAQKVINISLGEDEDEWI